MRILMLGNSFIYYNDLPKLLAAMLDAEVVALTRGGASLSAHTDPKDEMYQPTARALSEGKWDYVVLQDHSIAPVNKYDEFRKSAKELCERAYASGAKPLFYATWAYKEGSEKLGRTGLNYDEMLNKLYVGYHAAADEGNALVADVGLAFNAIRSIVELYAGDDFHPSAAGSMLAAATIAATIRKNQQTSD